MPEVAENGTLEKRKEELEDGKVRGEQVQSLSIKTFPSACHYISL